MNDDPISIHDAVPLETGGVLARQGFSFQDHVAVGFLLDLLTDQDLREVWCESHDDVTLIWNSDEFVEFVQMKALELNQLWSIAELTKRDAKQTKDGRVRTPSLLERSLEYDQYAEVSRFRIVTTRPPNSDLASLATPLNSKQRERAVEKLATLKSAVRERLPEVKSPNGNGTDYWVDNAVWDSRHDVSRVVDGNLLKLRTIIENYGEYLAADQMGEVYSKLLAQAKKAAEAEWRENGEEKKFIKRDFCRWFSEVLHSAAHPGQHTAGTNLKEKLARANLQSETDTAVSLRRRYRESVLQPKYLSNADRHIVEGEIEAALHRLRSDLDTDQVADDGRAFHAMCLDALTSVRQSLEATDLVGNVPPDGWMMGFMYNLTDRCPHRFRRISS